MTFDEARLLANVNHRAQSLFEDGYRIRPVTSDTLLIRSPSGKTYEIRRKDGQCNCPFFVKHEGRHPCKHLLGWPKLMLSQRERIRQMAAALEAGHG